MIENIYLYWTYICFTLLFKMIWKFCYFKRQLLIWLEFYLSVSARPVPRWAIYNCSFHREAAWCFRLIQYLCHWYLCFIFIVAVACYVICLFLLSMQFKRVVLLTSKSHIPEIACHVTMEPLFQKIQIAVWFAVGQQQILLHSWFVVNHTYMTIKRYLLGSTWLFI